MRVEAVPGVRPKGKGAVPQWSDQLLAQIASRGENGGFYVPDCVRQYADGSITLSSRTPQEVTLNIVKVAYDLGLRVIITEESIYNG
jgi:hypothetical protein